MASLMFCLLTAVKTVVQRSVYIKPVQMLRVNQNYLLQVHRPLYEIPNSGLYWLKTHPDHFKNNVGMDPACKNPCLHCTKNIADDETAANLKKGITCLPTDDTLCARNKAFIDKENRPSIKFDCEAAKCFLAFSTVKLNDAFTICVESVTKIRETEHIWNIKDIPVETAEKSTSVLERKWEKWTASTCRLDLTYGSSGWS